VVIDGILRVQAVLPHEDAEDLWVRLDKAHLARDEDAPKPLEKGKDPASRLEGVGAPVRESVERNLALAKLLEKLDRLPDRKHHFGEPVPPRLDQRDMVGEPSRKLGNALVERPPCILPGVPLRSAHRREELLNRSLRRKHLPVEQSRIPPDEDATEVEDCCLADWHRFTSFF
jgi:hypothetical protein